MSGKDENKTGTVQQHRLSQGVAKVKEVLAAAYRAVADHECDNCAKTASQLNKNQYFCCDTCYHEFKRKFDACGQGRPLCCYPGCQKCCYYEHERYLEFCGQTHSQVFKQVYKSTELYIIMKAQNSGHCQVHSSTKPAQRAAVIQQRPNAKVVFPYDANHPDDLSIQPGDLITRAQWNVEGMWSQGTCKESTGLFPSLCIQEYDTHKENLQHRAYMNKVRVKPRGKEGRYAGKDYIFKTTYEDYYLCAICMELARDATQSMCCGQCFCKSCIETWQAKKNSCPMCRQTAVNGFKVFNDVRVDRSIQGLQLYCPNFHMSCNWEGEMRGVKGHLDQVCQYTEVACPNGCGKTLQRYMVNAHLQECTLRRQACVFCEQVMGSVQAIPYLQLIQSHYKECPYVPVRCPNNCGNRELRRGDLSNHLEAECPKQAVTCEFNQFGCEFKAIREDLAAHLQTEVHTHLSLLMRSYCSLLQEVQRMKKRMQ